MEWREVRRRGVVQPYAERPPVRYQNFPSHRFYPRTLSSGFWNGNRYVEHKASIPFEERSGCETFFFNNFPEGCWVETLRRSFSAVGKVVDIFCPKKRDLKGKPFGFVRFEKGGDRELILAGLNNIWIGSFKIRAFVPRFDRSQVEKTDPANKGGEERGQSILGRKVEQECRQEKAVPIPEGLRVAGRSFLDILTGKPLESDPSPRELLSEEVFVFQSSEAEKEWLKNSFTASLKTDFIWEDIQEELRSECGELIRIIPMGGNLVHFQSTSKSPLQETLKGLDEWVSFWFDWIRPWEFIDVNPQRLVWTRWYGVPLQAWNPRFFETFGARFGRVLKIHDDTKGRKNLDAALVQLSTGLHSLDKVFECNIDGALFKIRIEESRERIDVSGCEFTCDSSESDFVRTEEEEQAISDFPANAQVLSAGEDGASIEGEEERHRIGFLENSKGNAAFAPFEVDSWRNEACQSIQPQIHNLEVHAWKDERVPPANDPRSGSAVLRVDLQEENCKRVGPSHSGPTKLGLDFIDEAGASEEQAEPDIVGSLISATNGDFMIGESSPNFSIPQTLPTESLCIPESMGVSGFNSSDLFLILKGRGCPQRKKAGRDCYFGGGCRRFLSQIGRRKAAKMHKTRGKSVDGRTMLQDSQNDVGSFPNSNPREELDIEVCSNPDFDPQILEGL